MQLCPAKYWLLFYYIRIKSQIHIKYQISDHQIINSIISLTTDLNNACPQNIWLFIYSKIFIPAGNVTLKTINTVGSLQV